MKSIKFNSVLNVIKTITTIVFPLITLPYVSRVLLPNNIGKVNFSISFVGYFSLVASLGISTYAIRECSKSKGNREELSRIASQIFSINIITTFIAYSFLAVALFVFRELDDYRCLILIFSSTIAFNTLGIDWLNSAMEDFLYITIRSIILQTISLILVFTFVRKETDYYTYLIITTASTCASNLLNFFYRKKYCNVRFTLKIEWKRHISPILFLFSMMLSQSIFNNADVTMLGLMKGDFEVGLYSTAHKVTNVIGQVVQSIIFVLIPRLSILFSKRDYENINRLLKKLLQFNIALGFPITTGVIMLSKDIVFIIGGAEFNNAAPIMSILILSFFFSLVGGSFLGNAVLIPSGKEKIYMIICCITAVVNVILNFALIPYLGAIGASISTAFNGLLIAILLFIKRDKNIIVRNLKSVFILPLIGCCFIALICYGCYYIDDLLVRVLVSIVASVIIYFLILVIGKYEIVNDFLRTIKGYIRKLMGGKND